MLEVIEEESIEPLVLAFAQGLVVPVLVGEKCHQFILSLRARVLFLCVRHRRWSTIHVLRIVRLSPRDVVVVERCLREFLCFEFQLDVNETMK